MNVKRLSLLVGSLLLMVFVTGCKEDTPEASKPTPTSSQPASDSPSEAQPVEGMFPASNPNAKILNIECSTLGPVFSTVGLKVRDSAEVVGADTGYEEDSDPEAGHFGCNNESEPVPPGELPSGLSAGVRVTDLSAVPASCETDKRPFMSQFTCESPQNTIMPTWKAASDSGWSWSGVNDWEGTINWHWVKTSGNLQLDCRIGGATDRAPKVITDEGEEFCNAVKDQLKFG